MDKCPFCGAAEISMPEGRFYYACGTYGISEEGRSGQCWKNELAALRALLEKVLPVVEAVARGSCCHLRLSEDGFGCIITAKEVSHFWDKQAQALLPEIKRAVGKGRGG